MLAFLVAGGYLLVRQQSRHRTPLFKYSFASFSNIMSAWFQYEALKFISFPTQVLAKSCKIIPVMIMGKVNWLIFELLKSYLSLINFVGDFPQQVWILRVRDSYFNLIWNDFLLDRKSQ